MFPTSKPSIELSPTETDAISAAAMPHTGYWQSAPGVGGSSAPLSGMQTTNAEDRLSHTDIGAIAAAMPHPGYWQSAPQVGNGTPLSGMQAVNAEDHWSRQHSAEPTGLPIDNDWLRLGMSVAIPTVISLLNKDNQFNQASATYRKNSISDAISTAGEVAHAFIASKGYQTPSTISVGAKGWLGDVFHLAISVALSFLQGKGFQASQMSSAIGKSCLSDAINIAAQVGLSYLQSNGYPPQTMTFTQ
ncbi:hypothetical protein ACFQ3P_42820 [Paraburkholderia sabiae]|uniref:Uncharacterized protein n=1 Tax=Paraburkholderia sabiae TaxID=273251 RepID=A0ABU9QT00_9BURK|nr:hypothetical protein [Paraburkholderia sabiae]WJZ79845.1 hypothetical protein QEN71_44255 [Paraburkholderia sabiae]CAD6563258.1 hypothetical protein LMG24235_08500 [Paraburkholderia sabiae]